MPSRKLRIKLYADECFPVPSVTNMKSLGYSITHAYDNKYIQKKDRLHLAKSRELKRVLITLDRDFMYYEQVTLEKHPGIIVISSASATPRSINIICEKIFKKVGQDFFKESLVKVTIDKIVKIKDGKIIYEKKY